MNADSVQNKCRHCSHQFDEIHPNQRYGAGDSPLPAQMAGLDDVWVLPTPTASDGMAENMRSSRWTPGTRHALDLPRAIGMMRGVNPDGSLLPSPIARDGGGGGAMEPERKRAGRHAVTLQDVTEAGGLLPDGTIR